MEGWREESHFKFGVRLGYILFPASMCWRQGYPLSKMKKKKKKWGRAEEWWCWAKKEEDNFFSEAELQGRKTMRAPSLALVRLSRASAAWLHLLCPSQSPVRGHRDMWPWGKGCTCSTTLSQPGTGVAAANPGGELGLQACVHISLALLLVAFSASFLSAVTQSATLSLFSLSHTLGPWVL